MHLLKAADVRTLTGLTADQLREWTGRRGLIHPDSRPCGPGSRARYAWQTVLLLRLAIVLKERFHVQLQAHRELFAGLREDLDGTSFLSLRGKAIALYDFRSWDLIDLQSRVLGSGDVILLKLDPHLEVLSFGFPVPQPTTWSRQFQLFPALPISSSPTPNSRTRKSRTIRVRACRARRSLDRKCCPWSASYHLREDLIVRLECPP